MDVVAVVQLGDEKVVAWVGDEKVLVLMVLVVGGLVWKVGTAKSGRSIEVEMVRRCQKPLALMKYHPEEWLVWEPQNRRDSHQGLRLTG